MVKKIVKNTICNNNLIKKGDVVILGLSGGPDSICLFYVLKELAKEMDFSLYCAHLNHKFRPGAAEEDQDFVEQLCNENNVQIYSISEDCNALAVKLGITSEEAGRILRYKLFDDIGLEKVKEGKDPSQIKIAVAQNLNDQAETLLFRIIRGTGTDGLAGIEYSRDSEKLFKIVRPLLDVKRELIDKYCEENNLNPRIDHTNLEPIYTRNKIRLNLIPYIQETFNENIIETVNRLSLIAKEDKSYIWKKVEESYSNAFVEKDSNCVKLDQNVLIILDFAILSRVIMKAFKEIGLWQNIAYTHLKNAESVISKVDKPYNVDFFGTYQLRVAYGQVICEKINEKEDWELKGEIKIETLDYKDYKFKNNIAAFDLDLLEAEYPSWKIVLRNRQAGDYIRNKGINGRKKIQNLFVDMKIPKGIRDKIFLVAVGNEILFIPSQNCTAKYNSKYKVTEGTKRVITVEIE